MSERLKAAWVMSLMDAVTALEGFDPTRVLDLGERVVGEATPVHRVAVQRLIVRATDVDGMGQGEPNDGSIRFALGPLDQVLLATRDSVGNQVSEPVETTLWNRDRSCFYQWASVIVIPYDGWPRFRGWVTKRDGRPGEYVCQPALVTDRLRYCA